MIRDKEIQDSLILYVEDELVSSELVLHTFKKKGFTNVLLATNGLEGLNLFKERSPVLVLTDIQMPEMDGLTMSEEIKKINPNTPIIITSAFSDTKYLLKAIEVGIDGYLIKPIKYKEMLELVNKLIRVRLLENEYQKERMLESIGLLASGFAHDFNNLLTPILGNISLAKSIISEDDKIYNYLQNAETSAEQARELIKKFMSFSKGVDLYKTPINIGGIIKDAIQHNVSPNVDCHFDMKDEYIVEVDSGLIYECISNIIKNACEAMPNGGKLFISVEGNVLENTTINVSSDKTNYIKITIRDTGKGMEKEVLARIFDPYFTSKKMDYRKGIGLGLSTAYSIIKAHKGIITAESMVNEGSTFYIYLPLVSQPTTS
ncbi:MAG: response regulator [Thermodesulfovibrionales bacterium]|nr:response regulator [Thermodesulfovibrionales bacterium]